TRCVFGVPPAPKTFHQAQPDTLNFVRTKFCFCSDRGQDSQSAGVCAHFLLTLRCWIGQTPQIDVICGICPENRMFSPEPAAGSQNPYRLAKLVAQRLTTAQ
ncbi:hypothetical protein, partial [Salmonella enterica]|uniref:hypothetical protein n=1 Tax=Salmonella enterica TaxID=28901 RepID=UPI001BAF63C7